MRADRQTDRYVDRTIGSRFVEVDCRNVLTFTTRNRICLCEMQLTPAQRDLPLISHKGCSAAMRPFAKFLRTLLDFRNKCTGPRTTGTSWVFPAAIPIPATRPFLPCGFSETEQTDIQTPHRRFTFSAVNAASVELGQSSDTAYNTRMPVLAASRNSEDTRQTKT